MAELVDVDIENLAPGGDGVGRQRGGASQGRVTFVPLTAPGDRVRARLREVHKRFARAELVQLESASPARVEPACPLFGRCGGCQWQHVHPDGQLDAKSSIAARAVQRPELRALAVGPGFGYRERARLVVGRDQRGQPTLGFHAARSHEVVDVPDCPLLAPVLRKRLAEVRARARDLPAGTAVHLQAAGERAAYRVGEHVLGDVDVDGRIELAVSGEPSLRIEVGAFSQVGRAANQALVRAVLALVPAQQEGLLELYAGAGNFTRFLSGRAARLVASDGDARARASGKLNLPEVVWLAPERVNPDHGCETVVADPPRAGLDSNGLRLALGAGRRIVYVSCDPQTLARDAQSLRQHGFALAAAHAFDLMPQTHHLELVCLFVRA